MSFLFLGFVVMAYMFAWTLYVLVEAPFGILASKFERLLMGGNRAAQKQKITDSAKSTDTKPTNEKPYLYNKSAV